MNRIEFYARVEQLLAALQAGNVDKAHVTSQLLSAFCYAVDQGIAPPPKLMGFIADGVQRYILNPKSSPWPTQKRGAKRLPMVSAMVQYINEQHPHCQSDIAAYLNPDEDTDTSTKTVGRHVSDQSDEITRLLNWCREKFEGYGLNELLAELPKVVSAAERGSVVSKAVHNKKTMTSTDLAEMTGFVEENKRDGGLAHPPDKNER